VVSEDVGWKRWGTHLGARGPSVVCCSRWRRGAVCRGRRSCRPSPSSVVVVVSLAHIPRGGEGREVGWDGVGLVFVVVGDGVVVEPSERVRAVTWRVCYLSWVVRGWTGGDGGLPTGRSRPWRRREVWGAGGTVRAMVVVVVGRKKRRGQWLLVVSSFG